MDFNVAVLAGELSMPPETGQLDGGSTFVRCLVTVRSDVPRRRLDVVPVVLWDPPSDHKVLSAKAADKVWISGSLQRRFFKNADGRSSRIEVVASHVELVGEQPPKPPAEHPALHPE